LSEKAGYESANDAEDGGEESKGFSSKCAIGRSKKAQAAPKSPFEAIVFSNSGIGCQALSIRTVVLLGPQIRARPQSSFRLHAQLPEADGLLESNAWSAQFVAKSLSSSVSFPGLSRIGESTKSALNSAGVQAIGRLIWIKIAAKGE
jgi:hypothetical protein